MNLNDSTHQEERESWEHDMGRWCWGFVAILRPKDLRIYFEVPVGLGGSSGWSKYIVCAPSFWISVWEKFIVQLVSFHRSVWAGYRFAPASRLNKFLPFVSVSGFTHPLLPIGSLIPVDSCCRVVSSPWLARKRYPFFFKRPTTCPRKGLPSRLKSTVYVLSD